MDMNQERVSMAKDIIARLDAEKMYGRDEINTHTYLYWEGMKGVVPGIDAKELLKDKQCRVCAKGALLVSAIDRFNEVKFDDLLPRTGEGDWVGIDGDDPASEWLSQYWDKDQLALMEMAYEGSDDCSEDATHLAEEYLDADDYMDENSPPAKALLFHSIHYDPSDRLRAIAQNIIDNNGEFKP